MTNAQLITIASLAISIAALLVSGWTRVEAFLDLRRQRRTDIARRLGEALVGGQMTKNQLWDSIDVVKTLINARPNELPEIVYAYRQTLSRMELNYDEISRLIGAMEAISIGLEQGLRAPMDPAMIEAKIARFNQIRILAQYDAGSAEKLLVTPAA